MNIIVGTAGHIDHGKTALVKALTGIDADRLPEEKRRGITIDLGFAELDLGEVKVGLVDVPGHERFVKNMLAGAHGIDLVILVVAADEGVMPQTREHFEICRLLQVKSGLVVLTKEDLVDEELLDLVKLDVAELVQGSFLEKAPLLPVSSRTGAGIAELKETLKNLAREVPPRSSEKIARLPIDRSFSVRGFGAVVTGTLISGEIKVSDEMELLPVGKKVRVRGLHTHGKAVEVTYAGQRTAVNLGGIEHPEIERGQTLAPVGILRPTQILDTEIEVLKDARKPLRSRARVRIHLGTVEALARVQILEDSGEISPGEKGFVQLRLESSVTALPDEHFVVRSYSPQITVAGGKILDGLAQKHRRQDFSMIRRNLQKLQSADKKDRIRTFLEAAVDVGLTFRDLQAQTGWVDSLLRENLQALLAQQSVIEADGIYLSRTVFENLATKTREAIKRHHQTEPLSRGMLRETLREKIFTHLPSEIFRKTLSVLAERGEIIADKEVVKISSHTRNLAPAEKQILAKLQRNYAAARLEVSSLETSLTEAIRETNSSLTEARKIFQLLLDSGELVKISDEFYFSSAVIGELVEKIRNYAAKTQDRLIDVPTFKTLAGISRKYAIPLLEYFDRQKITRRAGDKRLVL